jgi:general secretion pathway protein A
MTQELIAALSDHANGNYRVLMTMAGDLLATAAQRELTKLEPSSQAAGRRPYWLDAS